MREKFGNRGEVTLSAKGLKIGYNLKKGSQKIIHSDLDFELRSGEVTCLLGLNGAGKSTLLRTICGFQPSLGGDVKLLGRSLDSYSQRDISLSIGVVLTERTNSGGITLHELVALGRHPYSGFFGTLSPEDNRIVTESIEAVGITHKATSYVSELSDGERQKAMIAKALAQQCPIIILDEPTAFLDVTSRIETMILLRNLAKSQNKSILLSTHDFDMALEMADAIWLQRRDEPLYSGTPEDLVLNGSITTFFNRADIKFDILSGKLGVPASDVPIGVEGDELTTFWISKAVTRHGYRPAPFSKDYRSVRCIDRSHFEIVDCDGTTTKAESVAQLCRLLG